MLESLEQSNIKRMAVEKEVQPEVIFDPEKEISNEDWFNAIEYINHRIQDGDESADLYLAQSNAKLIFPDRVPYPNFPEAFEHINVLAEAELQQGDDKIHYLTHLKYLYAGKILCGKVKEDSIVFDDLEVIKRVFDIYRREGDWESIGQLAYQMKVLRPEIDLGLTDADIKNMESDSREFLSLEIGTLATLRVLFPNKPNQLSSDDWNEMREQLGIYKDNKWWKLYLVLASELKILAAKQVTITDTGINLEMRVENKEIGTTIPIRPEERNF